MKPERLVTVSLTVIALATIASACSSAPTGSSTSSDISDVPAKAQVGETYSFGVPGDEASLDQVVAISQSDQMRFDPASLQVSVGDTVRFDVTNTGQAPHEFVIGDIALQDEHEQEMGSMGGTMSSDEPFAIAVEPGQTKSLLWTFSAEGTFRYGCHVPGHYAAGMFGELTVA